MAIMFLCKNTNIIVLPFLELLNREGKKIALSDFQASKSAFHLTIIFIRKLLCNAVLTQNLTVLCAVKTTMAFYYFH